MEIRQLEYFVSASLLGNLTRVAERHFVSQPNITIAIKKLETELGVTLFDRKKNKLVLTEEGMFFLQKIEPILIALKNSVAEMKDYRNENGGIVTLGIPPMISLFLFSPLFKHFREIYPEMELSLVEEGTFGLHDKLSAGELDLAIVIINDCPKELVTVPLMTQQHVVC
ncbi:LysR family transcriptional regulator, partial [Salmonella enterica subsp. enterica serovar Enteritidis]|nr:LysR family transcriptional regulator [Salmonella enterica subsp. enterica serovar Enteritidis]